MKDFSPYCFKIQVNRQPIPFKKKFSANYALHTMHSSYVQFPANFCTGVTVPPIWPSPFILFVPELGVLCVRFDVAFSRLWRLHAKEVVEEAHAILRQCMNLKFTVLPMPRTLSINDLCLALSINLVIISRRLGMRHSLSVRHTFWRQLYLKAAQLTSSNSSQFKARSSVRHFSKTANSSKFK